MSNANAESVFITKLIQTGDWDTVDTKQIKAKYFFGKNRKAFQYIQKFKVDYGKVPSEQEFRKRFPQFQFVDTPEPMAYYCDSVRDKMKHNKIIDELEKVDEKIEDLDTNGAYSIIKDLVMFIENEIQLGEVKKINEDTKKRLDAYFERRNSGGISGIPTGLIPLDMMLGGIKDSDLITILGFTGTGKTWALAILATLLAKAGYKILFITREMNTDQMMMRIDAIWAGISYGDFSRGKLSPTDEQKLINYYDTMEENKDANLVVELATGGVTNCAAMIDKHSPDLVLVDGGYLMTEDEDEDDWKGVMKVWRGFKNIALAKKVPFIVTSQIKEADKVSLGKISFSKALANECDAVIALEQTEEMKEDKEIRWKPLKLRNSDMTSSFMTRWDFTKMDYTPIYVEGGKVARKVDKKDKPQIQSLEDDVA